MWKNGENEEKWGKCGKMRKMWKNEENVEK